MDDELGLDDRPRPGSARRRLIEGLKRSAPFSSLQRRIIFFNLIGLAFLVVGMTYLSNNKRNLIDLYVDALRKQGEIIAIAIAETAAIDEGGSLTLDPDRAAAALAGLSRPTGLRIRLYDADRVLAADTFGLPPAGGPIEVMPLDPPDLGAVPRLVKVLERAFAKLGGPGTVTDPQVQVEVPVPGVSPDEEVRLAAMGRIAHTVRVNSQDEMVVSVAMPIRLLRGIIGVLQLSTVGGDIERFVREERKSVLEIFILAAIVSILLSIVLANMIATPIRMLAQAASRSEGANAARPVSPDKPEIPDMAHRTDEIGELSGALIRMTTARYARIDAIESFAADVSHEIKNPLTSLRSAVETMQYAKTPQQTQKLIDVIRNDVARMDRLLTDISNASRLDAELVREHMEPFDMGQLVTMLGAITETEGTARNVRVLTRLPDGAFIARGLEGPVAQVITNLLNNALSFAPRGSRIRVTGGYNDDGGVRITVEDEGPGIPPENLGSIFKRFYSERPHSEAFGHHSGLGLSISKQIVDAHGGRIWAENVTDPADPEVRRGARFVFDLPG